MKKTDDYDIFSQVGYRQENPVAGRSYALININKSIIYVTTHERKTPNKAIKTLQVENCQHPRKQVIFLVVTSLCATLAPPETLLV